MYAYRTYEGLEVYDSEDDDVYSEIPSIYRDVDSGLLFEETHPKSRSQAAIQAHLEGLFYESKAQTLVDKYGEYGLSYERATELVTLSVNYNALSRKGVLTREEYDNFAMEAVGTTATEIVRVIKEGDKLGGLEVLRLAAQKNGIGEEHAFALLSEKFGMTL